MTQWKMTTAAALAGLTFVAPAFAQAAMGGDEKVKAAQQALKDKGHDPGTVDGRMGAKTQAALRDFQKAQGMQATGRLDSKTVQSLGMDGAKTSSAGESATSGSASPPTATEKKAKEKKY
jgi:peptidoglycan hydrolase-like protein with peptidoglycan-binding domain